MMSTKFRPSDLVPAGFIAERITHLDDETCILLSRAGAATSASSWLKPFPVCDLWLEEGYGRTSFGVVHAWPCGSAGIRLVEVFSRDEAVCSGIADGTPGGCRVAFLNINLFALRNDAHRIKSCAWGRPGNSHSLSGRRDLPIRTSRRRRQLSKRPEIYV